MNEVVYDIITGTFTYKLMMVYFLFGFLLESENPWIQLLVII